MGLFGFGKKKNKRDEYDAIYGDGSVDDIPIYIEDDYGFDFPGYDEVYDEQGCSIPCDGYNCNAKVKFHNGQYECPKCGKIFDRADFFAYIGANPPGPKCVTCDNLYPGCIACPHGYVKDEF